MMNNNLFNSPERNNKLVTPNSPQSRRKNIDIISNGPIQSISNNN